MSSASNIAEFFKLGLLGAKLDYSLSPKIHRAFFQESGLAGSYELLPEPSLPENFVARLEAGGYAGFNVTIPYKAAIIAQLKQLSEEARLCQAVNTVLLRDGLATGYNTDIYGFEEAARALLAGKKLERALLIGAGGASRAAFIALERLGFQAVTVSLRGADLADFQAKETRLRQFLTESKLALQVETLWLPQELLKLEKRARGESMLVINASPLGQNNIALPGWLEPFFKALARESLLFDMVYAANKKRTPLLEMAWDNGFREQVDGKRMLVLQAAQAFYLWTGVRGSLEAGLQALA